MMKPFRITTKTNKDIDIREAEQLHVTPNGALCGLLGSRIIWAYQADNWLFAEDAIDSKKVKE